MRLRIASKNPRLEDYDYGYEEPDASTCSRIVIETYRNNGLRVQIEKLVPNRILSDNKLSAGSLVSLKYEDLEVSQFGVVMHVAPCPEIAPNSSAGEGQVVVSRFTTFDVELLVRLDFEGSQSLTGTSIHHIWSLDRQDWVAMGDLEIGERLQETSGPVTITSTHLVAQTQNVYNIEVQGEHVYEVTELGILVHNTNDLCKQITEIQEALQKDPTNKELIKKQADLNKQLDEDLVDRFRDGQLKEKDLKKQGISPEEISLIKEKALLKRKHFEYDQKKIIDDITGSTSAYKNALEKVRQNPGDEIALKELEEAREQLESIQLKYEELIRRNRRAE